MPSMPMELNPAWKGGRTVMSNGYIAIKQPDNPNASEKGYVLEHVLVAQNVLGRPLPKGAVVHHVNEIRSDNRPENLVILQSNAEHQTLHKKLRALKECGDSTKRKCVYCHEYDDVENMHEHKMVKQTSYYHNRCSNEYRKNLRRRKAL